MSVYFYRIKNVDIVKFSVVELNLRQVRRFILLFLSVSGEHGLHRVEGHGPEHKEAAGVHAAQLQNPGRFQNHL